MIVGKYILEKTGVTMYSIKAGNIFIYIDTCQGDSSFDLYVRGYKYEKNSCYIGTFKDLKVLEKFIDQIDSLSKSFV